MQADAENSLLDLGPAPALPDKSEFGLEPPAGGGAAYPPQAAPFNYPSPMQPQQPGAYPPGASSAPPFSYPGGAMGGAPGNQYPALDKSSEKNLLGKYFIHLIV